MCLISCSKFSLFTILVLVLSGCGSVPEGTGTAPSSSGLIKPVVNVSENSGSTILNWNGSNADQFRVLIWQGDDVNLFGNDAPQEYMTNGITYTLPSLTSLTYTIIVEAYDELGNSLFSAPVTAVVR